MTTAQVKSLNDKLNRLQHIIAALQGLYRCHYDKEMQFWLKAVEKAQGEQP